MRGLYPDDGILQDAGAFEVVVESKEMELDASFLESETDGRVCCAGRYGCVLETIFCTLHRNWWGWDEVKRAALCRLGIHRVRYDMEANS